MFVLRCDVDRTRLGARESASDERSLPSDETNLPAAWPRDARAEDAPAVDRAEGGGVAAVGGCDQVLLSERGEAVRMSERENVFALECLRPRMSSPSNVLNLKEY